MNRIGQEALLMSTDGASLTTMPGGWCHCSLHEQSSSHATSDLINQSALSYLAEESLALKKELYELPKRKNTKGTYRNNFFPVN